jgi:excisionase family DNA binding protein
MFHVKHRAVGAMPDRRNPARQQLRAGGRRRQDPPLTTRDCADWLGVSPDKILRAIEAGFLRAERFREPGASRDTVRIHGTDFHAYCLLIGFRRLPPL